VAFPSNPPSPDRPSPEQAAAWVVWNGSAGLLATATLGRVEPGAAGRSAWLAEPFDMVGPFDLDALEAQGQIAFAACIVMSRERWQRDQVDLRRESLARRRAAQARQEAAQRARFHESHHQGHHHFHGHAGPDAYRPPDDRPHREALNLARDEPLAPAQIKAAFRRMAQKAHPDVGGSHEQFLRITEARNALLARFA